MAKADVASPRDQTDGSAISKLRARITDVVNLFATPLQASHYVELVNPLWSSHKLQARVESVWDETRDARTITLRPGRNWRRHRAGQHVRIGVPIGGRRFTRTYSISSSPERRDGCITITVKVARRRPDVGPSRPSAARGRLVPARRAPPGRLPRARGGAGASAVHHRRQRRHAGHEHAADLGRRRQHARRRARPLRAALATT